MGAPPSPAPSDQRVVGSDDTVPASNPPDDDSGPELPIGDRYQLGAELGRGGMGRVVEAFDTQLGRTVALKEVLPRGGPGIQRRFLREVQITARLEHASIVPLYDSGVTADGRPFYVMRRVSGKPLDEMIARARGLGERLALLPAMLAAIDAVAHAHRRGVIHRDLKPANILVGDLGETVVIDWGLAKVIGEAEQDEDDGAPQAADSLQTQIGSVFGTPGFMPPEQARGEELGTRGDVYALGATLYQLLAARPPHVGRSATEVLSSTHNHSFVPLTQQAPGVPPELVAIVEKALSFDAGARYPNAAALGEDVRRFNTGQLVAAHHYTPRQRLGRFTRRHRAPLGVAALALVAVAVLAWFGVHRIVTERDLATAAREDALRQKQDAVASRDRLVERQDALTIMHATTLLDTNPTEAVAVLKQLPATSSKRGEAVGLARAAEARGVAWAMQISDAQNVVLELSPDAMRLAQTTFDGMVHLWDLDRRRLILQKHYPGIPRAIWVKGATAVLVSTQQQPPELLEVATGVSQPLPITPLSYTIATEAGDRVAALDPRGNALSIELATSVVTPLWPGHVCNHLELAPDGSWILLTDEAHVLVIDSRGKELVHRDGKIQYAVVSQTNKLAVLDGDELYEARIAPDAPWTRLPPPPTHPQYVFYRGDHLVALVSSFDLVEYAQGGFHTIGNIDPVILPIAELSEGRIAMASSEGKIHVLDGIGHVEIRIPGELSKIRLVSRRGSSRLIAAGGGLLLDYDLDELTPRQLDSSEAVFVDNDTILLWGQGQERWGWYDLPSRTTRHFEYPIAGLVVLAGVDPASGRVLLDEHGATSRLILLDKHANHHAVIATGAEIEGRLIDGGGVLFTRGGGQLLLSEHDEPPHEIIKLDGAITGMVPLGNHRYAAVSRRGEVVRGNFESGDVERIHLDPGEGAFVANSHGLPLIAADSRLLLWDRDLIEIAKFAQRITGIDLVAGGALVSFADHESMVVELRPGGSAHRILPPSHDANAMANADGTTIVGLGVGAQIIIVDLPARSRWTLPTRYDANSEITISPNGRWVMQRRGGTSQMLWPLPPAPAGEIDAWFDELTNATEDADGVLTWPWQLARTP